MAATSTEEISNPQQNNEQPPDQAITTGSPINLSNSYSSTPPASLTEGTAPILSSMQHAGEPQIENTGNTTSTSATAAPSTDNLADSAVPKSLGDSSKRGSSGNLTEVELTQSPKITPSIILAQKKEQVLLNVYS